MQAGGGRDGTDKPNYPCGMSGMGSVSQIYVGAPIDVASERNALARVVRTLEEQAVAFVVLANIHLGGRQVDLVIATARGLWVVEVKSSHLPLRGEFVKPRHSPVASRRDQTPLISHTYKRWMQRTRFAMRCQRRRQSALSIPADRSSSQVEFPRAQK
jgi:hypothetical protein